MKKLEKLGIVLHGAMEFDGEKEVIMLGDTKESLLERADNINRLVASSIPSLENQNYEVYSTEEGETVELGDEAEPLEFLIADGVVTSIVAYDFYNHTYLLNDAEMSFSEIGESGFVRNITLSKKTIEGISSRGLDELDFSSVKVAVSEETEFLVSSEDFCSETRELTKRLGGKNPPVYVNGRTFEINTNYLFD